MAYAEEIYNKASVGSANGSNYIAIQYLDANNDYDGDPILLPALSTSGFTATPNTTETELEDGETKESKGIPTREFTATFAQTDARARQLFDDLDGKKFTLLKENKRELDPSGGYQYFIAAEAELSGDEDIQFKEGTFDMVFRVSNNAEERVLTLTTFANAKFKADFSGAADITIPADKARKIFTQS